MDAAQWTIFVIAILIVVCIALSWGRSQHRSPR